MMDFQDGRIRQQIEDAYQTRASRPWEEDAGLLATIAAGIDALDAGSIAAARLQAGNWVAEDWVRKLIMLSFLATNATLMPPQAYDKVPLKFTGWDEARFATEGFRVVPGAIVRRGAYIAPGAVLMPCFINIGARVGAGSMIDAWATVGSCAQVGEKCHISGGAGLGGVLEPLTDRPVIVEDRVFVGARAEIAEGVCVRAGAVISMGTYIGRSTPIIERSTGTVFHGEVPENAVVIPGGRLGPDGVSTYAAIIVKYADGSTRSKTALNQDMRTP